MSLLKQRLERRGKYIHPIDLISALITFNRHKLEQRCVLESVWQCFWQKNVYLVETSGVVIQLPHQPDLDKSI